MRRGLVILAIAGAMLPGIVRAQQVEPIPGGISLNPGPSTSTSTAPAPRSATTSSGGNNITVVIPSASDEEIEHDARVATPASMDAGPTALNTGLQKLVTQSLETPAWLLSRDKSMILDKPEVKSLNDGLRFAGLGLWIICLGLVLLKHLAAPFTGVDIMDLSVALPVCLIMGAVGWWNQAILDKLIDVVGALITTVATTPVQRAITPGLSFNTATTLIVGPILGVIYDLLSLWLIFKLWLQIAWLWILGAAAPLYITVTGAPFLGKYGSHWWHNWMGTLIDPILVVIGLVLCIPWFDVLKGAPDLAAEALRAFSFLVILSTLGWHQGAYRPQSADILLSLALFRLLRGSHHSQAAAATQRPPSSPTDPVQPGPPPPPDNPHAVSGQSGGSGGGTAGSWWKSGRWSVSNETTERPVPRRAEPERVAVPA